MTGPVCALSAVLCSRWQHVSVMYGDAMYVFGGMRAGEYLNDMWIYNPTTQPVTDASHTPTLTQSHQFTPPLLTRSCRPWRDGLLLMCLKPSWTELVPASSTVPFPRMAMASAMDATLHVWYLYGGWSANSTSSSNSSSTSSLTTTSNYFLSDFWRFSFNDSTWALITQPEDATEFPSPGQLSNTSQGEAQGCGRTLITQLSRAGVLCLLVWSDSVMSARAAMSDYMFFLYESVTSFLALPLSPLLRFSLDLCCALGSHALR